VRRVLHRQLRPKFDSLDFVQLVWQSFFRMHDRAGRFERPQQLVAFLARVACNKVNLEARQRLTEKHDVQREISLNRSGGRVREQTAARGPGPLDMAIARERWDRLLQDQPPHYRRIIHLRLQGHTSRDIGKILDLDEVTIHRFLKKLFEATVP
jgi:RNA polymerase sigma-70 factor (ECF subfamily)